MQIILAIDGDERQAEQLLSLVRGRLGADLVQATSAGEGLQALGDRVPDLIMTSPILSPFDDGVLAEYLRELGDAGAHVQTLRIPVLGAPPKPSVRGLFSLRRTRPAASTPDGCDPNVFAEEIAVYLARAAEERHSEPVVALEAEARVAVCEPVPEPAPEESRVEPEVERRTSSFESALAAIRAAWGQPHAASAAQDGADASTRVAEPLAVERPVPQASRERRRADKARARLDKVRQSKARESGRPEHDEWGVFDPGQCGFSALVEKLDEVTDTGDTKAVERATVRVVSLS